MDAPKFVWKTGESAEEERKTDKIKKRKNKAKERDTPNAALRKMSAFLLQKEEEGQYFEEARKEIKESNFQKKADQKTEDQKEMRKETDAFKGMLTQETLQEESFPHKPFLQDSFFRKEGKLRFLDNWRVQAACSLVLLLAVFASKLLPGNELAQLANANLKRLVAMDMELEPSLGEVEFVQEFLPESVLVFWNAKKENALLGLPMQNAALVEVQKEGLLFYSSAQPVLCVQEGRIEQVEKTKYGYCVTVKHAGNLSTRYEALVGVSYAAGDRVEKGVSLGLGVREGDLYFCRLVVLRGGKIVDPEKLEVLSGTEEQAQSEQEK